MLEFVPYDLAIEFWFVSFLVWLVFFIWLMCKLDCDSELFVILSAVLMSFLSFYLFVIPDNRTRAEKFQAKLNESNMTLDDMVYFDEGKIFKFEGVFYIKTNSGEVLVIQSSDAEKVYK